MSVLSVTTLFAAAGDVIVRDVNLGQCKSYTDGCNTCSVGEDGVAACTMMQCVWAGIPKCLDSASGSDDTQLTNLDNSGTTVSTTGTSQTTDLNNGFKLQTFSSCDAMDTVMSDFIWKYMEKNPYNRYYGRGGGIMIDDMAISKEAVPATSEALGASPTSSATDAIGAFSETNIQVAGVDESEIVKTDGKRVYYFNQKDNRVYIAQVTPAKDMKILRSIVIPQNWSSPELYIQWKKLVIIATKYHQYGMYDYAWFDWSQKTVVAVYDTTDIKNLKIDRYFQVDGSILQSRKVGQYLYTLSVNNFHFPYAYYGPMVKWVGGMETQSVPNDAMIKKFSADSSLPKKLEIRKTSNVAEQNFISKSKKLPYNLVNSDTTSCDAVEYILPDEATMDKFNFSPSFVVLSMIDLEDSSKPTVTKVLFGDVSEIHMGLDKVTNTSDLFITSSLYSSAPFSCPVGAYCAMPYFRSTQNTLIHKMTISGLTAKYADSAIIPGTPINQYAMDEDVNGNFRVVTRNWEDVSTTNLYILDKNLKVSGKIEGIAPKENFQAARFLWDKLYLVTFEQIDPLFVIDLSDTKNPKILWELKIPGYSTYLHPYDATHLIGIGYDTKDNGHGGTINAGLKVDLYDISDLKNPKQQYSLTLGDNGSSSEALTNPRMFTWYPGKKLLLIPATLFQSANDPQNYWRHINAWQGTIGIKIDVKTGIQEDARVTHIDRGDLEVKRQKDCAQYKVTEKPVCKKLLTGEEYCPPVNTWVPEYCYADSSINEYFANQIWGWNDNFIIRNLYVGDTLYTLSNTYIRASSLDIVASPSVVGPIPWGLSSTYATIANVSWK